MKLRAKKFKGKFRNSNRVRRLVVAVWVLVRGRTLSRLLVTDLQRVSVQHKDKVYNRIRLLCYNLSFCSNVIIFLQGNEVVQKVQRIRPKEQQD